MRIPERWLDYFRDTPRLQGHILVSSKALAGVHYQRKENKIAGAAVFPLPPGTVVPSFDKPNLPDPTLLEGIIKEAVARLRLSEKSVSCLIPDVCVRAALLPFDSLPAADKEREKVIRWRIQKQMPLLAEDTRLVYEVLNSPAPKVLAVVIKESVVREYEVAFERLHFRVGHVGIPSLSLLNLAGQDEFRDSLIVNIEEESLCLIGLVEGEMSLYRLKPLVSGGGRSPRRIPEAAKEIENTIRFIEDREKRQVRALGLRLGVPDPAGAIREGLRTALSIPVLEITHPALAGLAPADIPMVLPLLGQIP
jgi:hypothetical protein